MQFILFCHIEVLVLCAGSLGPETDQKKREREEKRQQRQKEMQEKREAKKGSGAMKLGAKKVG